MYTVKPGKSLGSDRGKKTSTKKVKHPLSFEIWIFRNGQPYCDDHRNLFLLISKYLLINKIFVQLTPTIQIFI